MKALQGQYRYKKECKGKKSDLMTFCPISEVALNAWNILNTWKEDLVNGVKSSIFRLEFPKLIEKAWAKTYTVFDKHLDTKYAETLMLHTSHIA